MSIVPFRNLSQQGILIDLAPYSTPLNAWTNGSNVRFDNGKAMRAPVFRAVESTLIDTPYFVAGFTPSSGYDQVFFVGVEGRVYNYQNAIVSEVSVPSLATSTITILNGGTGYTLAPTVTISAPTLANGVQATATASLTGGVVSAINIVNGGFGYATPPTITLSAPTSGTRATASCTLNFTPYSFVQAIHIDILGRCHLFQQSQRCPAILLKYHGTI